jgi:hypothetical protein
LLNASPDFAALSLWFYRSQQDTDYRKVLDKLDEFRSDELTGWCTP